MRTSTTRTIYEVALLALRRRWWVTALAVAGGVAWWAGLVSWPWAVAAALPAGAVWALYAGLRSLVVA